MALLPAIWSHIVPSSRTSLISKVTSLYGVQGDSELETVAEGFLNDAIDDANTHLWEFNKIAEDGAFTAGQQYLEITPNAYREVSLKLVSDDGTIYPPLRMYPWTHFEELYGNLDEEGTPQFYSYRNLHREGRIYLYPHPPTTYDSTTDYTYTLTYYRRIPHLDEEDPLQIPREIEQLITYGAKKRMAAHLVGSSHPDVASYAALEAQAMAALKGVDKRSPAESLRFNFRTPLGGMARGPVGGRLPWWWLFGP